MKWPGIFSFFYQSFENYLQRKLHTVSPDHLTMLSSLDGRYASQVEKLSLYFSEYGLIHHRVKVEIAWLRHLAQIEEIQEVPCLTPEVEKFLDEIEKHFSLRDAKHIKSIESVTNHDVKAVEYWIKEQLDSCPQAQHLKEFVHFACTSEDINNISYALMLKGAHEAVMVPTLEKIIDELKSRAHDYASLAMMSRTHGQPASPTTMGKELANFIYRLQRQIKHLKATEFLAKLNGAVGNYNAHRTTYPQVDWIQQTRIFIEKLGLLYNPYTTQIEPHDYLAEYFYVLIHINTILIDFNRDIWGYIALDYFKQKLKEGEIGSSTMPHKVNPIDFENSEGNLGLANSLLCYLAEKLPISRWQRDLSDSTVLRNIGVGLGHALLAYASLLKGLSRLQINQEALDEDLSRHWELLAEPIQTVMRRYGLPNPYEQLKQLTRTGKPISEEDIKSFIEQLDLPEVVKTQLLQLSPQTYVGDAILLAESI